MRIIIAMTCFAVACAPHSQLVKTVSEAPGPNCANGGIAIQTGTDSNDDSVLQDSEVDETSYVCNGGPGRTAIVDVVVEPAGPNCANGGSAIRSGTDVNANGTLDNGEVQETLYVCNGANGSSQLVATQPEPAGSHCPLGGVAILVGSDTNIDGMLSSDEVVSTSYVCNGG